MRNLYRYTMSFLAFATCSLAAGLTGNWVVAQDMHDGTFRKTYFNLKQDGQKIAGTIRVTQFFYAIKDSTGDPANFTITGSMIDNHNERKVTYEGKFDGEVLRIGTRRRPEDTLNEQVAHRAP